MASLVFVMIAAFAIWPPRRRRGVVGHGHAGGVQPGGRRVAVDPDLLPEPDHRADGRCERHGVPDGASDANARAHADADRHSAAHATLHPSSDGTSDGQADRDAEADRHPRTDADADARGDAHPDPWAHARTDPGANTDSHARAQRATVVGALSTLSTLITAALRWRRRARSCYTSAALTGRP